MAESKMMAAHEWTDGGKHVLILRRTGTFIGLRRCEKIQSHCCWIRRRGRDRAGCLV